MKTAQCVLFFLATSLANQAHAKLAHHCKANERVVFNCEIPGKKGTPDQVASVCSDQQFSYLAFLLGEPGKASLSFPKATKDSLGKFAMGQHQRPGGYSIALGGFEGTTEITIDASFETAINKETDTATADYSVDVTDTKKLLTQELTCSGRVVDNLEDLNSHVKKMDYFAILEGLGPKEQAVETDETLKAALKTELEESKKLVASHFGNSFQVVDTQIGHGLSGDFDGDSVTDKLIFVEAKINPEEMKKLKNLSSLTVPTSKTPQFNQGIFLVSGKNSTFIYLTGFNQFGTKKLSSDDFAVIRKKDIDDSYSCNSDGLVLDDEKNPSFILCHTKGKLVWNKELPTEPQGNKK